MRKKLSQLLAPLERALFPVRMWRWTPPQADPSVQRVEPPVEPDTDAVEPLQPPEIGSTPLPSPAEVTELDYLPEVTVKLLSETTSPPTAEDVRVSRPQPLTRPGVNRVQAPGRPGVSSALDRVEKVPVNYRVTLPSELDPGLAERIRERLDERGEGNRLMHGVAGPLVPRAIERMKLALDRRRVRVDHDWRKTKRGERYLVLISGEQGGTEAVVVKVGSTRFRERREQ